jgi:bacterial leucyl aminopeptidase
VDGSRQRLSKYLSQHVVCHFTDARSRYPIEGHAYGGEEGGLLGSSAVAHAYKTSERELRGMLNLEMVGWQPETEGSSTITVLVDPNEEMSRYMEEVVREYVPTAVVRSTTCGVRINPFPSAFIAITFLFSSRISSSSSTFLLRHHKPKSDKSYQYGCSDHYSWSSLGYPVVCIASYGPNDSNLNPNYHSVNDTIDKLNFERMADFARAALAWVVQVGS